MLIPKIWFKKWSVWLITCRYPVVNVALPILAVSSIPRLLTWVIHILQYLFLLRWNYVVNPQNVKLQLSITFSNVGLRIIHQSGPAIIFKPSEIVEPSWINGFCHSSRSETSWFFCDALIQIMKTNRLNPSFQYISFSGWIGVFVAWILLFNSLIWSRVQNIFLDPKRKYTRTNLTIFLASCHDIVHVFNVFYHQMSQWIVASGVFSNWALECQQ